MSIFLGIENIPAEGAPNRRYFEPGIFKVQIEKVFLHEKRLGGGKIFIVETTVLASDNPKIKLAEQRNWVQSLASPYALPRIKAFISSAIDAPVTSQICEEVIGDKNLLKGKIVNLVCINKLTKTGKNFTHCQWGVNGN